MILCDTNILIEFYKNNLTVIQTLQNISLSQLAISTITQAELYYGALNKEELIKIKKHLSLLSCLSLDATVSDIFIELMETYALSHKISLPDAMIAATAISNDLELFTLNHKDFHFIEKLKLYPNT